MLEKMKQQLEKEFEELCNYSDECYEKHKILEANTDKIKLYKGGVISIISLIPSLIATGNLVSFISVDFPMTLAAIGVTASSLMIGYVGQKIITSKSKKEMRKFASVKTNEDILQQSMYYELEMEKAEITKDIYREMYKNIETRERLISNDTNLFKSTNINENLSKEEISERKEKLEKALEERSEQLTVLVSQRFLRDKFDSYRNNKYRIPNIIADSIGTGAISSVIIVIPFALELTNFGALETNLDFLKLMGTIFSPTIITSLPASVYYIKRDKDYRRVFKSMDLRLGEHSLSKIQNPEYEKKLDQLIESTISEAVELGIKLRETTYSLENLNLEESTKKDKEFDWTQHLGRNSVENILNDTTAFPDKVLRPVAFEIPKNESDISWVEPYLDEDIEEDEVLQQEENNSRLVRKLTPTKNTGNK